jgi:2-keto-3-deoxy-L-rhamnonate aldolase RhmA
MRTNRVKQLIAAGQIPVGHMVWEFKTRGIATIVDACGCDFALVDMEHSGFDLDAVADLLAWMMGTRLTPIVRVPDLEYHFVARCLDAGALGIMFPNIESEEEAREAVAMVKYPPAGRRGAGLSHAHTGYATVDAASYIEQANAETMVIAQIESGDGVANVDRIAAVEGVDVLWVGHSDLSVNLGIPGQFDNPMFGDAIDRVIAACRAHGKGAGLQPASAAFTRWALERGFNCLSYGADSSIYRKALQDGVDEMRLLIGQNAAK